MKTLMLFFNWIIRLFKTKKTEEVKAENSEPIYDQKPFVLKSTKKHNNRKRTNGRPIQEIRFGNTSKFIYQY